jgi:hypothetical protein
MKASKTKGRLLSVYLAILVINLVISFLLITGERPASPAEIIEAFFQWMGVNINGGK